MSLHSSKAYQCIGKILPILAAIVANVMSNTSADMLYEKIIYFHVQNNKEIFTHIAVKSIVNDGLMTLFFLAISLELKQELIKGTLSSFDKAVLPAIAALGGMVVPALTYILITSSTPILRVGWAIPSATDIAFSVIVLALLGDKVPSNLKAFLLTLAVIDDLGAIATIAVFYSAKINLSMLIAALCVTGALALVNYANIQSIALYLLAGVLIWGCILVSGIHATLAGVIVGAFIPSTSPFNKKSPADLLLNRLRPWLTYLILPLFAFTNAGVSLKGLEPELLFSCLPMGVIGGLVIGKPIGILLFITVSVKCRLAKIPDNVSFRHISAASLLCGIGFTMSIFIANLAFEQMDSVIIALAKFGILLGSLIAALLGYFIFDFILRRSAT